MDIWRVVVTTGMLAAGREELRKTLAEIVKTVVKNGWVSANTAERWLEKLERGCVLREGLSKYEMGLTEGASVVRHRFTNLDNIKQEAQRLRELGLEEGRYGYVYIRREGLRLAAWLSVYGSGRQRGLAAEFVEYIPQRAEEAGMKVYKKAKEIIEKGEAKGSLTLKGFEKEVEVDGEKHVVKVIDGSTEFDVGRSGKLLLRIGITAEVDGVRREYVMTYGRHGADNAAVGRAYASVNAPGGR